MQELPSAFPTLGKPPRLPEGSGLAACVDQREPFDELYSRSGAPNADLVDAAASVCSRCPVSADCSVRVRRRKPRRATRTGGPRPAGTAKDAVVAVLREKGEATAPEISAASGHSLPSIKSAVGALHKAGRLAKRSAPPGAGNRVYLSLSGDEAWAAERTGARFTTSPDTSQGDHERPDEGRRDHDR
jgi:hypothetical protein